MSFNIINPYQTFRDSTGKPRAGGFVTFFINKETEKSKIFSDENLLVAQENPYTLDAYGRVTGDVKFSGKMTMQEMNADGSDVITTDDVTTIGSNLSSVNTMADLLIASVPQTNIKLLGFHTAGDGGGGEFFYDATALRTTHDGATIIDPGNPANLAIWDATARTAWFTAGTGLGCWIRIYSGKVDVAWGGATVDQTDTDNTDAINKLFAVSPAEASFKIAINTEYTWTSITIGATQILTDEAKKDRKGADIASATALVLGQDGDYFDVTGTTAITSIGTFGIGDVVKLHFDGILTLTHHATDLILPGAANITTAAGDEAEFIEYATGDWRMTNYQRNNTIVANHIRAGNKQIIDGNLTLTLFDLKTNITETVFESIGPTGSGATNIIPDMDSIPASATIALFDCDISVSPGNTGTVTCDVHARAFGTSAVISLVNNAVARFVADIDAALTGGFGDITRIEVPIDSLGRGELTWNQNSATHTVTVNLYYRGFITD